MKSHRILAALAGVLGMLALAALMGAYALPNYATLFQIQPYNASANTQTVAAASGCTLGVDSGAMLAVAGSAVVPSGGTFSTQAGSTFNISGGTVTLPAIRSATFAGLASSGGTGSVTLTGATNGDRVLTIFDVTGGTTAAGPATASFAGAISSTAGALVQTSTANLSAHTYAALLLQTGP